MTLEEFELKFEQAKVKAFRTFFNNSPVDTGYLRSMIKMENTTNGFVIYNDVDYMQYTEEPRRGGARNPNEGWFRDSLKQAFNMIVEEMRQ